VRIFWTAVQPSRHGAIHFCKKLAPAFFAEGVPISARIWAIEITQSPAFAQALHNFSIRFIFSLKFNPVKRSRMNSTTDAKPCPKCGEPLQPHWNLCPNCGVSVGEPICPRCQSPVKDRWKICPECGAPLLCPGCGNRLAAGRSDCPACRSAEPRGGEEKDRFSEPVTGIDFVRVTGGKYLMGDGFGEGVENELPVHEVRLDTFYLGRFPVTQSQWNRLMRQNPSSFKGADLPVEQVTWQDVQTFIRELIQANPNRQTFRLPTEAEWEYAARSGGLNQRYAGGDDPDAVAWYNANSGGQTHPVGSKAPNGLGICDMSGNVWEWCRDRFAETAYQSYAAENPLREGSGEDRVIRGGSWNLDAWSVRCTRRMGFSPEFAGPGLGFRLAMAA
jgi:formylglycine-generating enzyme required for sulfatase activity